MGAVEGKGYIQVYGASPDNPTSYTNDHGTMIEAGIVSSHRCDWRCRATGMLLTILPAQNTLRVGQPAAALIKDLKQRGLFDKVDLLSGWSDALSSRWEKYQESSTSSAHAAAVPE